MSDVGGCKVIVVAGLACGDRARAGRCERHRGSCHYARTRCCKSDGQFRRCRCGYSEWRIAEGFVRKRAETDRLAALLKYRAIGAATRNPTRFDLVERIEQLIADYNAGSLNIDEYLRRLIDLSRTLTDEEQRSVTEGLTEEELAIFDLLTKPDPVLTDAERALVHVDRVQVELGLLLGVVDVRLP